MTDRRRNDEEEQLRCFRSYQETGSYRATGEALGLSVSQVRRSLIALYARLGVNSAVQASARLGVDASAG